MSENLQHRAGIASCTCSREQMEVLFQETAKDVLLAFVHNPHLREADLLRLLERKDLPQEVVREIADHREARKNYAVKLSLVRHPKTPRLVSLPLMKFLYIFDLVGVARTPAVPTDVKMAAEEAILRKLQGLPTGEKVTMARRGTGRVAASLLISTDEALIEAALDNPYLTESHLFKVLSQHNLPPPVVQRVAEHARWSHHYYLRLALIRNPLTPFARVLAFLPDMAVNDLLDICYDSRMPEAVRKYVRAQCVVRLKQQRTEPPQG